MKTKLTILVLFAFCLNGVNSSAQNEMKNMPSWSFKNGIGMVTPDSTFSLNFRFRMQNRAAYYTVSEDDFSASEIEARVRRLRMRIEGFVLNPKITYYVQLSFSRGDMDWSVKDNSTFNNSPNIVRDAVVYYRPNKHFTFFIGQTKLPGNRQRVVSSGDLQFADRSIVNSTLNIDRDFGIQAVYENNISDFTFLLKGAITSGEGRNSLVSDAGLAYTGRIELLPFGKFTNKGDYFEGDLEREQKPKLALAGGYHYNENAWRTAGTLGKDLYEGRSLSSIIADVVFKYKGFALTAEYISRTTDNPITTNSSGSERVIYTGDGKLVQASYIFKNNYEIAARYAIVTPESSIRDRESQFENLTLGLTKYLNKHRLKLQGNVLYNIETEMQLNESSSNWGFMFQVELGI
jgi:phosphate-selective porin OprO/OprP